MPNLLSDGTAEAKRIALLSDRARGLIRLRARQDAEGCHTYQGTPMMAKLMDQVWDEAEREYEVELQRQARLKEVVGG